MSYLCTPTLINNTITQNRPSTSPAAPAGSGIYAYAQSGFTGKNNIIYGNIASLNPEFYGNVNLTYSCSSEQLMGTGNLVDDPEFLAPAGDDFHLQATSPCIDAGDPSSPLDPDGTRADMGALYYDQGGIAPNVTINLTPINPPIQIPAAGGSFNFDVDVINGETTPQTFDAWIMVQLPNMTWFGPVLGPISLTLSGSVTLTRTRTQSVPASAPAGSYTYEGRVGDYPGTIWDSDSFPFTKLASGDASAPVFEWTNSGQSFEVAPISVTPSAQVALRGAIPNPFNPTTAISYALPQAGHVTLMVYDLSGREVATVVNGWRDAGSHQVTFDGSALASGVYVYRLTANGQTSSAKMILMK